MKHTVTEIQRFCMHDGPGIRTTVFLKGCPLNCFWCHNPETKTASPQLIFHETKCIGCMSCADCKNGVHFYNGGRHGIAYDRCDACGKCAEKCPTGALGIVGKQMDSNEIIETVLKDKAFYGKEGGITLSGGEPMLHPEACIELLSLAKEKDLNTAVETCGYFPSRYVERLCKLTDCLLWDIKDTNSFRHAENTGKPNELILENLRLADSLGVPIVLRFILLKGINTDKAHFEAIEALYISLKNVIRADFTPCHSLGNSKLAAIGKEKTELSEFEPTPDIMEYAERIKRRLTDK